VLFLFANNLQTKLPEIESKILCAKQFFYKFCGRSIESEVRFKSVLRHINVPSFYNGLS